MKSRLIAVVRGDVEFSSGRERYAQTAFFISRLLPVQWRMQVKATELAPRYEVAAVLHSEAKREPVSTALLHFSPLSRLWFSVGGHRPHQVHTDGTSLCNANVSQ